MLKNLILLCINSTKFNKRLTVETCIPMYGTNSIGLAISREDKVVKLNGVLTVSTSVKRVKSLEYTGKGAEIIFAGRVSSSR